jgi:hypothetical protein
MNVVILLVLIGLLVVEVFFVCFPEPILLIWPDSIGYLGPAADAIESGRLTNWNSASGGFVYPLIVWGMLLIAPEPWPIVFIQRLVVIATFAALAAAFWWLWRAASDRAPLHSFVGAGLMTFWLLTFVLYPPVIGLGQSLMPEVLFSFALTLVLVGLVAVSVTSVPAAIRTAASWLTPFLSVALVFVKPHWMLGAVVVPILMPWLAPRQQRRMMVTRVAISLGLALALIVVPEGMWQEAENARFNRVFGPRSLFCNSADLIHGYLAPQTSDPLAQQVDQTLAPLLTPESRAQARVVDWNLLDFDGNRCTWGPAAEMVHRHFDGRLGAEVAYYLGTYLKAAIAEPIYVPRRLWRQLGAVASKPFNNVQAMVFLTSRYFPVLEENRDKRPLFARWHDRYGPQLSRIIELPTRDWLLPLRAFFALAGIIMSAGCLVGLGWITIGRLRQRRDPSETDRAFIGILACALALNTLIALVHTFDVPRYAAMQTPMFSLLGYAASVTLYTALMLRGKATTNA